MSHHFVNAPAKIAGNVQLKSYFLENNLQNIIQIIFNRAAKMAAMRHTNTLLRSKSVLRLSLFSDL